MSPTMMKIQKNYKLLVLAILGIMFIYKFFKRNYPGIIPTDCYSSFLRGMNLTAAEIIVKMKMNKMTFTPGVTVMMYPSSVKLMCSYLKPNMSVLEWGSGGSTLFYSKYVSSWYSIEHNKKWSDMMQSYIRKMDNSGSIHFDFVPPTPDWKGGWIEGTYDQFSNYVERPIKYEKKFDLIIVDGRARVPAAKSILRNNLLKSNGVVIIHDWERQYYHELQKCFRVIVEDKNEPSYLAVLGNPTTSYDTKLCGIRAATS